MARMTDKRECVKEKCPTLVEPEASTNTFPCHGTIQCSRSESQPPATGLSLVIHLDLTVLVKDKTLHAGQGNP